MTLKTDNEAPIPEQYNLTRFIFPHQLFCEQTTKGLEKLKLNNTKGAINNNYYEYFTNDSAIVLFSHYTLNVSTIPLQVIAILNLRLFKIELELKVNLGLEFKVKPAVIYLTAYVRN